MCADACAMRAGCACTQRVVQGHSGRVWGLLPAAAWGCTHWGASRCLQCGACASRKRRAVFTCVWGCVLHTACPRKCTHSVMAASGAAVRSCVCSVTRGTYVCVVSHLCECVQSRTSACCAHAACADTTLMAFGATATTGLRSGGGQLGPRRLWGLSASDVCSRSAVSALRFQEPLFLLCLRGAEESSAGLGSAGPRVAREGSHIPAAGPPPSRTLHAARSRPIPAPEGCTVLRFPGHTRCRVGAGSKRGLSLLPSGRSRAERAGVLPPTHPARPRLRA